MTVARHVTQNQVIAGNTEVSCHVCSGHTQKCHHDSLVILLSRSEVRVTRKSTDFTDPIWTRSADFFSRQEPCHDFSQSFPGLEKGADDFITRVGQLGDLFNSMSPHLSLHSNTCPHRPKMVCVTYLTPCLTPSLLFSPASEI